MQRAISIFWVNDFPPVTSGIATFFLDVMRGLPPGRFRVYAPRMAGAWAFDRDMPFRVDRVRLPAGDGMISKLFKTAITALRAVAIALGERPAKFHCGQIVSSGLAGLLCNRLFGTLYVVYVFGSETARLGCGRWQRWLLQRILKHSEWVVTNSDSTSREFLAFGVAEHKLLRVYPGVDLDRFRPLPPDEGLIQRLGLTGKRVLLTVARLDQRKGHDTVMSALAGDPVGFRDVVYLIVGDGREKESLVGLSERLGLEGRVIFAGSIPDADLPAYYSLCDVFVMPNRVTVGTRLAGDIEGFGIAFAEAAACGRPSVGGRSGGAVEAILDGETGLLVDPASPEGLARAIGRFLSDDCFRERSGRAARRRAESLFDSRRVAGQILEIL